MMLVEITGIISAIVCAILIIIMIVVTHSSRKAKTKTELRSVDLDKDAAIFSGNKNDCGTCSTMMDAVSICIDPERPFKIYLIHNDYSASTIYLGNYVRSDRIALLKNDNEDGTFVAEWVVLDGKESEHLKIAPEQES